MQWHAVIKRIVAQPVAQAVVGQVVELIEIARELTAAFSGAMPDDVAADAAEIDDLAGEFANMVCGRWLTDVAPRSLFTLARPVVGVVDVPSAPPMGLLNGHPIWITVAIEG